MPWLFERHPGIAFGSVLTRARNPPSGGESAPKSIPSARETMGVGESAQSDPDHIRPPIAVPIHGRAASRAEMDAHLARLLAIANVDSVRPLGADVFLGEKGATRNGPPVRRWHSVQWQAATTIGSANTSARSDPQQQWAVLFTASLRSAVQTSSVRFERRFSIPARMLGVRLGQWRSRLTTSHRRRWRVVVLTAASTA